MKNSVEYLSDEGNLLAIFIPSQAATESIEFLTRPENEFQVGLMKRDENSQVKPHVHKLYKREINRTHEFLLVRAGSMKLSLFGLKNEPVHTLVMNNGDSVLLCSGGHSIDFLEPTLLLEVKQGPYSINEDKSYLNEE